MLDLNKLGKRLAKDKAHGADALAAARCACVYLVTHNYNEIRIVNSRIAG